MIKPIDTWTIICDNCGKDLCEGDEFSGWNDQEFLLDGAIEAGWNIDGGDYCDECFTYDDNDNLVINEARKKTLKQSN
jgi:hypothetical protein